MKNLLISALVAWLIHSTDFIVDCTTMQYIATLFIFAACTYGILAWLDDMIRQSKRQHRHSRPIQRCSSINFEGTRL